jgi:hypothetical protein
VLTTVGHEWVILHHPARMMQGGSAWSLASSSPRLDTSTFEHRPELIAHRLS